MFATPSFPMKTRSYYLNHLCMYLGGLAAETLVFREFTDAAGDPRSDLNLATSLAMKIEYDFGMGSTLAINLSEEQDLGRLRASDFKLRAVVDGLLANEFTRAMNILDVRHQALHAIAENLLDARVMSAEDVKNALDRYPAKVDPLGADTDRTDYPIQVARQAIHQLHNDEIRREMNAALRKWGFL